MGSLRLERYFKDSSMFKRLRKAAIVLQCPTMGKQTMTSLGTIGGWLGLLLTQHFTNLASKEIGLDDCDQWQKNNRTGNFFQKRTSVPHATEMWLALSKLISSTIWCGVTCVFFLFDPILNYLSLVFILSQCELSCLVPSINISVSLVKCPVHCLPANVS